MSARTVIDGGATSSASASPGGTSADLHDPRGAGPGTPEEETAPGRRRGTAAAPDPNRRLDGLSPRRLRRAATLLVREGPRSSAMRALYALGLYRDFFVSEAGFRVKTPRRPGDRTTYRTLGPSDLESCQAARPDRSREELVEALQTSTVIGAFDAAGHLAAMGQICFGSVEFRDLPCSLHFSPDTAYQRDYWVRPDARGGEVLSRLADLGNEILREHGATRKFGLVWSQNRAGLGRLQKRNHPVVGRLRRIQIGPYSRLDLIASPGCDLDWLTVLPAETTPGPNRADEQAGDQKSPPVDPARTSK